MNIPLPFCSDASMKYPHVTLNIINTLYHIDDAVLSPYNSYCQNYVKIKFFSKVLKNLLNEYSINMGYHHAPYSGTRL